MHYCPNVAVRSRNGDYTPDRLADVDEELFVRCRACGATGTVAVRQQRIDVTGFSCERRGKGQPFTHRGCGGRLVAFGIGGRS